MESDKIVVVHLRRPGANDPRNDPFWEFGSFGITGCHIDNLLNPKKVHELEGMRLAFAQGGRNGFKLVFLTPGISIVKHKTCSEARWQPVAMPLKYDEAPLLVANNGRMMRGMREALQGVDRSTLESRFSSRFRSRRSPLNGDFPDLAREIATEFDLRYEQAKKNGYLAKTYDEALPWRIKAPDRQRQETYQRKLDEAGGVLAQSKCGSCKPKKEC
jgi:hypothetical protein